MLTVKQTLKYGPLDGVEVEHDKDMEYYIEHHQIPECPDVYICKYHMGSGILVAMCHVAASSEFNLEAKIEK